MRRCETIRVTNALRALTRPARVLVAVVVLVIVASPVRAQFGGGQINRPLDSPTFSPYLNMLRSDSGPGQNYYGLVRPQQEFAMQNQMLGQQLDALQMQGQGMMPGRMLGYSQLGTTGHPVLFNSFGTSHFSGGYTGVAAGGFGGGSFGAGGFGGGMNGGFNGGMSGGFGGGTFGGMQGAGLGANSFGNQAGGFGAMNQANGGFGGGGFQGSGFAVPMTGGMMGASGHPAAFGSIVQPNVGRRQ